MRVTRVQARAFRSYERVDVTLSPGLTVIHGPNGAGKTNLLEAIYFGCTGRSCRTSNDRELVSFGAEATNVSLEVQSDTGIAHTLSVGFAAGENKRFSVDGSGVERLLDSPARPLVSVFLPDRLELVKGPPALRRSHLDAVIAAGWPVRAARRAAFRQALGQRNALLARVRSGAGSVSALRAWDHQLAAAAIAVRDDRADIVARLVDPIEMIAGELGLTGALTLRYRPRTTAPDVAGYLEELDERRDGDVERGFSSHGPQRDDIVFLRSDRDLRSYGSQGEQRLVLLALLLAERDVLASIRGAMPVLLLDDVMSELDPTRRERLAERLRSGGQTVITTTELSHVPHAEDADVRQVAVIPRDLDALTALLAVA